jgi:hypothetical protein
MRTDARVRLRDRLYESRLDVRAAQLGLAVLVERVVVLWVSLWVCLGFGGPSEMVDTCVLLLRDLLLRAI